MSKLPINLTTPHGHRVEARVDDKNFQVEMARVVIPHTGVQVTLSQETINNIADLVRNNQHHAQAINEMGLVFSNMLPGLRTLAMNDPSHPGVAPYFRNEIEPCAHRVEVTKVAVEQLKLRIGTEADHQIEKPAHGVPTRFASKDDGSHSV